MQQQILRIVELLVLTAALSGCATSSDIVVNPGHADTQYRSAYLVAHGDRSSDVDAAIQRELLRRGLAVSAGADGKHPETAELIVKYADDWNWDLTMYLESLDIQVYDAKTGVLVATANWKNSAMHGFHGLDKVVKQLLDGIAKRMKL